MKRFMCALLLAPATCLAQKKPVLTKPSAALVKYELRGIVTYYFNANYGYKPDVGATAYIVKNGAMPADSLDAGAAEAFRSANVIYSLSSSSSEAALLPGEESPRQRYLSARLRLDKAIGRIEKNPSTSTVTTDGQGIFLKKLTPGTYWVLVKSAGRQGAQMKKAVIVDDDTEVSAKFEAD